jgi:hypothetical protein
MGIEGAINLELDRLLDACDGLTTIEIPRSNTLSARL